MQSSKDKKLPDNRLDTNTMPVVTRPRRRTTDVQGKLDFPCRKTRSRSVAVKTSAECKDSSTPLKKNCTKKCTETMNKKKLEICDERKKEDNIDWLDDVLIDIISPKKRQHDTKDDLENDEILGSSPVKIKRDCKENTNKTKLGPSANSTTSAKLSISAKPSSSAKSSTSAKPSTSANLNENNLLQPDSPLKSCSSPRLSLRKLDFETSKHLNTNKDNLPNALSKAKHLVASPRRSPRKENLVPKVVSPRKIVRTIDFDQKSPSRKAASLYKNEVESYMKVKKALHTSVPDRLLCREKETSKIMSFLQSHVAKKKPGSLYISGAPGTGKTACLSHIIKQEKELMQNCKVVFLNCMTLKYSNAIFSKLASDLGIEISNKRDATKQLEKEFTRKGQMILMVLDEIDYLDSKNQEVLYTMFEWPSFSKSRAVLIGIANALDLTDRILPRLQSRINCRPDVLNFAPYSKDQIVTILSDRLKGTETDEAVFEGAAIQFCARKVSSIAGDIRKALDVCRRAVDIVSADVRSQTLLKPMTTSSSPSKPSTSSSVTKKVGLLHISNVISDAYDSCLSRNSAQPNAFPLQQKLAVCTLLLLVKHSKMKDVTLGKLHETYTKVCNSRQVPPVDQSEFLSLCHLIETRGVIGLKKAKETRLTKICLKLAEKEVEFALQDKVLLSSILKAGLPSKTK